MKQKDNMWQSFAFITLTSELAHTKIGKTVSNPDLEQEIPCRSEPFFVKNRSTVCFFFLFV